jgi:hypothetical protein
MSANDAKAAYIKLAIEILSSYQKLTENEIQSQIQSLPMSERERQSQILQEITNNVETLYFQFIRSVIYHLEAPQVVVKRAKEELREHLERDMKNIERRMPIIKPPSEVKYGWVFALLLVAGILWKHKGIQQYIMRRWKSIKK